MTEFTAIDADDRSHSLLARSEDRMHRCWLLAVTRGLNVWLPPEVYVQHGLAVRESDRWRVILRLPTTSRRFAPQVRLLHLIETEFPESWRACPIWAGVTWSERSYPKMRPSSWLLTTRKPPTGCDGERRGERSMGAGSQSSSVAGSRRRRSSPREASHGYLAHPAFWKRS